MWGGRGVSQGFLAFGLQQGGRKPRGRFTSPPSIYMPRHLLLVCESLLKPRSSLQREYVRMTNLACFYSAPLAVSCGCSHCDPELEAGGAKLTCIPYVHLHSVHLGRDLQELSLRPSPNPPHMNHCCLGNSEHGHGSSH